MDAEPTPRRALRVSALPQLVEKASPRVLVLVGLAVVVLGMLVVFRPLTSLMLLAVYVGLSAIVSGIFDLAAHRRAPHWWTAVSAVAWVAGGLAMLIFLGRSLDALPVALAVLLIIGGVASVGDALVRGRASQRVLSAASGGAQIVFGILALTWPDVTVLVVAVVFGVRTIVFGATLLVRGGRGVARSHAPGAPSRPVRAETRRRLGWFAAGRYALALLLVATAAGGWFLDGWLEDGAPVIDAFYNPPDDPPEGHGRLIRSDEYQGRLPVGGTVDRILYTTRDALGRPAVASGLVITPDEPADGPRPVVLWNHGTTGVAQGCAPSLRDDAATKWAIPALEEALARGWVVISSDYSGQGAPGDFPYLIGRGEARSSLDAVLAAAEIPDGPTLSPETVVWGHSQGGHAALWSAQLAAEYTPGLDILGAAVLSPVTDPLALADVFASGIGGVELSIVTSWVLVPYSDTYWDVEVNDYVAAGARTIVREMTQRCPTEPGVIVSVAAALGVSEDRPLYDADLASGPLAERLAENAAVGPWTAPILIGWGSRDEVIPPRLQQDFVDVLCTQGHPVRWSVYAGYDHLRTLLPGSRFLPTLVRWTDARFDARGDPVDDCARYGGADAGTPRTASGNVGGMSADAGES